MSEPGPRQQPNIHFTEKSEIWFAYTFNCAWTLMITIIACCSTFINVITAIKNIRTELSTFDLQSTHSVPPTNPWMVACHLY